MYRNILVPVSFDSDVHIEKAVAIAKLLAAANGKITLLHVMEHIPSYAISYVPSEYLVESRRAINEELAKLSAGLKSGQGVVIEGHSGRTILDYAEEHDSDCIVIASHRPGMADYFLGSTASQVVRHAVCAVHVVR